MSRGLELFLSLCSVWLLMFIGYLWSRRRPWSGKLGTWELDPAVEYAKRKHGYWPEPDQLYGRWIRPHRHSYCLRCGKWPFRGKELMYTRTDGIMTICHLCGMRSQTTAEDLRRYAHQVVDIKICQNFDPHFTHPDSAMPITHYFEMWHGLEKALAEWEADRG